MATNPHTGKDFSDQEAVTVLALSGGAATELSLAAADHLWDSLSGGDRYVCVEIALAFLSAFGPIED